ncbi:hypothetical protein IV38_GL000961 [Lactobacillus selangorensis]|uniref:Integral membrane protein n=1 Tax=Lactobacillus selangorensis TaxID=81857 RepID=A0A0R2FV90_9LACO|nr:ECF transporter S component [Lactobacillus selangorensis]KRN28756.1 hypothetical protein IV38_GL000961 [Lactobacillus selangorensis]KRN32834.1 hypothetical protein IV40_GL000892 [Lactobacillus selangorensis]
MKTNDKTKRIAILGVLLAIIIVQTQTPFLGFIPLGITTVTIIHITVIVAAIVLGPVDGMVVGLFWGILTMIRAWTNPTSPIDPIIFTNPVVAVLPRVLVGLVAGVSYQWLVKWTKKINLASIIAALLGTATNTILVVSLEYWLYTSTMVKLYHVSGTALVKALSAVMVTSGGMEALVAAILTPLIVRALFIVLKPKQSVKIK